MSKCPINALESMSPSQLVTSRRKFAQKTDILTWITEWVMESFVLMVNARTGPSLGNTSIHWIWWHELEVSLSCPNGDFHLTFGDVDPEAEGEMGFSQLSHRSGSWVHGCRWGLRTIKIMKELSEVAAHKTGPKGNLAGHEKWPDKS